MITCRYKREIWDIFRPLPKSFFFVSLSTDAYSLWLSVPVLICSFFIRLVLKRDSNLLLLFLLLRWSLLQLASLFFLSLCSFHVVKCFKKVVWKAKSHKACLILRLRTDRHAGEKTYIRSYKQTDRHTRRHKRVRKMSQSLSQSERQTGKYAFVRMKQSLHTVLDLFLSHLIHQFFFH